MNIFEFIDINSNDLLSKMNEKDRDELLNLLRSYKIALRDKLNLRNNTTFGLELEFGTSKEKEIESKLKSLNYKWLLEKRLNGKYWDFKKELSSIDGYEITTPISFDEVETWKQLESVCNLLKSNNVRIGEKDAGHVNFGSQILGNNVESWLKFFRLYSLYENTIYRFSYGEFECERPYLEKYAFPIAKELNHKLDKLENPFELPSLRKLFTTVQTQHKVKAMQFYKMSQGGTSFEKDRRFEFRMPNATAEPIIWQNNVNFFAHLLYAAEKDLDIDEVKAKINRKFDDLQNIRKYNYINIDEALELADLIFDNNLDKINFLRQYMKEFKTSYEFRHTENFIKR